MRTALRRLLAAAQAFALSACMLVGGDALVTPGGAEDFPNTVTALGRIAVGDISSSTQWEQAANIELPPVPDLGGLDSLQIEPPQAKFAVLGKAAIDTLDFTLWQLDYNRPLELLFSRRVYAYAVDSTATRVRRDTVTALYLGSSLSVSMLDSVQADPGKYLLPLDYRGAVTWPATGVRQSYRLRNLDFQGDMDVGEYVTLTPLEGGGSLRKWVKIHGAEGAFRNPNPVPEEYELLRRGPAGDTLEWTLVKDADWDRRLWNDSGRGVVDLFLRVRNPESQPDLLRMHVYMRAGFHYRPVLGDSLSQLQYQEQRWLRNGRIVTFTFQGAGASGALLLPNDTARMTVDTVFALRDSMIKYNAAYDLILGSSPDRMQEHKLRGYAIGKFWRRGPVFSTRSTLVPTVPVSMGQADFSGAIAFTAAYVNGDTVKSEGTMSAAGLNLTVSQVKQGAAQTYQVVLDAAGKLIQATPVPPDATGTARRAILPARP
jgi:hypothetical protein